MIDTKTKDILLSKNHKEEDNTNKLFKEKFK